MKDNKKPTEQQTPDTSPATETAAPQTDAPELVPLDEVVRYRKRALEAETHAEQLKGQVQDAQVELEQARQAITQMDQQKQIDALLSEADVIDIDVARLLTEVTIQTMDDPDLKLVVDDLRRHKPYLFRATRQGPSSMPAASPITPDTRAQDAAERAASTGDRRELLRYLRLRRNG